jgi:hypothetical protein
VAGKSNRLSGEGDQHKMMIPMAHGP